MAKVSIKTGDTVLVTTGKDSGKKGKVIAVKTVKDHTRVVVEGVNLVTKAKKARTAQEKSELVKKEAAIDVSNVNVVCPACGKATRVRHAEVEGKKHRVCAKCGASLDGKFVKETKAAKKAVKEEKTETAKTTEKPKTEKKSRATKAEAEKATKTAVAKKPQTSRSSQRGV
ncbi:MAG: 50S ribosomal protein L24 [Clostridia bacterium]|nr:50S ribosomal protein L24 [Clostridia bacterium]